MSVFDHEEGEMRRLPLNDHSVDALLDGRVVADDAPPGYQHVARLVHAAKAPATAGELAGEDHVVATLATAVGGATGVSGAIHEGRRPVLTKLLTAKMAAAAAAALLGGGAAAAATGSLPTSLQTGVSHGLSAVGISVPDPSAHQSHTSTGTDGSTGGTGSTNTASTSTPPTQAVGPSASGPAAYGLCTAYAASSGSQATSHSVAFRNLAAAANAKNESVTQYCAAVTPPSTAPSGTGSGTGPASPSVTPSEGASGTHVPATASDHAGAGAANSTDNPSGTHVPATASDHAGAGAANSTDNPSGTHVPATASDHASAGAANSTDNPSGTQARAHG